MPPANITLVPATQDDLAAITDVFAASFQPRRPFGIWMAGASHDDIAKFMYVRQEEPTEGQFSYKAIDTNTNQVVGWMQWMRHAHVPSPTDPAEKWLPKCTNVPLLRHFFDTMNGNLIKLGESIGAPYHGKPGSTTTRKGSCAPPAKLMPSPELKIMCVRSEYERQGIAGALLEIGLALADEEKLPVIVSGSENGAPLYRRHGFEDFQSFSIDGESANAPKYIEAQLLRPAVNG